MHAFMQKYILSYTVVVVIVAVVLSCTLNYVPAEIARVTIMSSLIVCRCVDGRFSKMQTVHVTLCAKHNNFNLYLLVCA